MQPTIYNISYYRGDTFTLYVFPKDSTGAPIPLDGKTARFRIASARGENPEASFDGQAEINQLIQTGPWGIFCKVTSVQGDTIKNGYVYDIGYSDSNTSTNRVTVLTGNFVVLDKVFVEEPVI